jgi:hypothetical protein
LFPKLKTIIWLSNLSTLSVPDDGYSSFIVLNATFSNIMTTSFIGGRSRSTRREPPTMGKQLVIPEQARVPGENHQQWVSN